MRLPRDEKGTEEKDPPVWERIRRVYQGVHCGNDPKIGKCKRRGALKPKENSFKTSVVQRQVRGQ